MQYDRIKVDRKRLNLELARKMWTLTTLAKEAGVCYETMRRSLNSKKPGATPVLVGKIANALGVDVVDIIEGE